MCICMYVDSVYIDRYIDPMCFRSTINKRRSKLNGYGDVLNLAITLINMDTSL